MLCKCGCGAETSLAKRTDPRYGTVEGQPLNYVSGHHNVDRRLPASEALSRRRESHKKWLSKHPEATRRFRLKKLGWTEERVEEAKQAQGNRCAICNEEKELQPDHKHCIPPKPRGMLCGFCNRGVGMFREKPEVLEAAAQYLRRFS